jgi:hypothetical protein
MIVVDTNDADFDASQGAWLDDQLYQAVREQWGRHVARVADTQTDGKWVVVLAPMT